MSTMKKRLLALLMTLVLALSLSVSAFAAEPTNVITEDSATSVSEEANTRATDKVLSLATTTITGGSGVLYVNLPSGNFWADFVAQIGYSTESGAVVCSVTTPDGEYISLGAIAGTGSSTVPYEVFYAPAGTYAFYFSSANTQPMDVIAYIYD